MLKFYMKTKITNMIHIIPKLTLEFLHAKFLRPQREVLQ